MATALARALAAAVARPDDVRALAAAAYACDREGREHDAVGYYQRAFDRGGPPDDRAGFLLGFGSTLRNVGRVDDAVAVLAAAVVEFPDDAALRAFLALALHGAGHPTLALATMLDAGLATAPTAFAPYRRALGDYARDLQLAATPALATPAVADPAPPAPPRPARSTPRRASRSRRSR